ncbi:MAG: DNA-protecting protein DprA [Bacilli bacterium]|nr:DNA-protecting protein DprA [Bacilli bacterium]
MIYYDGRLILIHLAVKYGGDFDRIYEAMKAKEDVPYETALKTFQSLKCKVMTILDYDYPAKLKQAFKPPFVLFYYGDISLLDKRIIATVGSREVNEVGKNSTEAILKDLIPGNVLISGMARGIDTIAHVSAIKNKAKTIAVLGSGIDYVYPYENKYLYNLIKKSHLVISEYPGSSVPEQHHFPARNRIVVALSDCVIVPQINDYATGTMVSVNIAVEMGKPVIVAPHPYGVKTINNQIIGEGAIMAVSDKQIKEELGWKDENFLK